MELQEAYGLHLFSKIITTTPFKINNEEAIYLSWERGNHEIVYHFKLLPSNQQVTVSFPITDEVKL